MAWRMSGQWVEACSCKMVCRCTLGPTVPDEGWCSGVQVMDIRQGNSDGVDLSGTKVALGFELPGDFFSGIDVARLYIDESASADQRRELEEIFMGKKGGVWEALGGDIRKWLPSRFTKIQIQTGDNPSFSVGDIGQGQFERVKTEDGRQAKLLNAPVAAAFGVDTLELAQANSAGWSDPEMRRWESGGAGAVVPFNWSG